MHKAQAVANHVFTRLTPNVEVSTCTLTSVEASKFRLSLQDDARASLYSGAHSIAEAIQGLDRRLYSWTTVKLYYSAFYFARATLALHGVGIIYRGTKAYEWVANVGQSPSRRKGQTHKVVLDALKHHQKNSILFSQLIGIDDPYTWLMTNREMVNYTIPRFCEPDPPAHFKFISGREIRQLIGAYIKDNIHLYTFDPDHAMLAFPMAALKLLLADFKALSIQGLSRENLIHITSQVSDRNGPIPDFQRLFTA